MEESTRIWMKSIEQAAWVKTYINLLLGDDNLFMCVLARSEYDYSAETKISTGKFELEIAIGRSSVEVQYRTDGITGVEIEIDGNWHSLKYNNIMEYLFAYALTHASGTFMMDGY